jgi:hypothetical protein
MHEQDGFAVLAAAARSNLSNKQADGGVAVHQKVLALNTDFRALAPGHAQEE